MPAPGVVTIVSAKLSDELFDFIEDYRWSNRLTKTTVLVDALTEWAKTKGYEPHDEAKEETPAKAGEPT